MHSELNTDNCFDGVSGALSRMPSSLKKWNSTLGSYREKYSFMCSHDLRESVSMLKMNFDYQYTLFSWLKPKLVFEEHHKYILYQIIGAIYEALIMDFLISRKQESSDVVIKKIIDNTVEKRNSGLGSLVNLLFDSKVINGPWKEYLDYICEVRNTVHPSRLKGSKLARNKALALGVDNAAANLDNFVINLRQKY